MLKLLVKNFSILQTPSRQILCYPGQKIFLDYNKNVSDGDDITLTKIFCNGKPCQKPVTCKVLSSRFLGDKLIIFKKKRRKGYERQNGFRQLWTVVTVPNENESVPNESEQ